MKKILALTLAAVMAAGMTTTAFAADVEVDSVEFGDRATLFKYSSDDNIGKAVPADERDVLEPGATYYISLKINGEETVLTQNDIDYDSSDMNKYKAFFDEKYGELGDFEVDYKKIETYSDNDGAWDEKGDYRYVVVFTTPEDNDSNPYYDVAGSIKVGTSSSKANKTTGYPLDVTVAKDYIKKFDGDFTDEDGNEYDNGAVVKFEKDLGEIDIDFGEEAMFTVDATGQGRLNLIWNTDFLSEIADLDKSANMDFLTFKGEPRFNKNGTMYIYASDDTFLYEVVDGKLEKVDADYNEDYEAWEFKTRTLGTYVISDKELDLETINTEVDDKDDSSSTTEDGNKKNPDTGR